MARNKVQHGRFTAEIDGDFGEITEAAVKAYHEFNNLNPDGIVGAAA